jgi:hypothetical protein
MSLKVEQALARVHYRSIEDRVQVLMMYENWRRLGPSTGIPRLTHMENTVTIDFKEAEKLYDKNLFLLGGVATEMRTLGKTVLGIRLPASEVGPLRDAVPVALESGQAERVEVSRWYQRSTPPPIPSHQHKHHLSE